MDPQTPQTKVTNLKIKRRTTADENMVDHKYTFLDIIGNGYYSKIWKALDNTTRKTVAIKEINKCKTTLKTFSKELKYGKKLSGHPNICRTHSWSCKTESAYFLAQDFAHGGDLCSAIISQGRINETACKLYFFQICLAVEHMHDRNLVHLDIKPDNILLRDFSSVVLADFGLTERVGKKLSQGCGTLAYMAPEAFNVNGLPVARVTAKHSLDMWSLGVLLFSMLTGEIPWGLAVLSDLDFFQFYRWQMGMTHPIPVVWRDFNFTPELRGLLRVLFAVNPKHRCKIQDVFCYFDKKWLE